MAKRLNTDAIENKIIPVDLIDAHPDNYNAHPDEQISGLAASHDAFGQYRSVVVWARPGGRYTQVAGHGYLQAAKGEGLQQVRADVLPIDTPAETVKAILVSDNLHAKNSTQDEEMLAALLQEQVNAGFDLSALGTDDETLRQMLESLGDEYLGSSEGEGDEDEDAIPEDVETRCKAGEIWQLGKHRLLIGDSTSSADIKVLMHGEKADMVFTDPPYGMRLDTDYSHMPETAIKSKTYRKVIGDDADFNPQPLLDIFGDVAEQFWWGADYYYHLLPPHGSWIVWDKRNEASDGLVGNHFEVCWSKSHHRREMKRLLWSGFTAREPNEQRVHPTQKPTSLCGEIIESYSKENALVVDPYLGSGTTLIACERLGRRCYGCEIDPHYADVIITRWETHTGQEAKLLERLEPANAL